MESLQKIHAILSKAGIKPSVQRTKILEFLLNNNIHPSVDKVYIELLKEIPTLSKTTVYNTLKLFETHCVINGLSIDDNEMRYDAFNEPHGHFKCQHCGKIFDFNYKNDLMKFKDLSNFLIKHTELNIKGLCPDCK